MTIARHPLAFAGVALAVSAAAQAAVAAPPDLPSAGGLLVLANVRVEKAARPVDSASRGAREAGMKAYKDQETGALRKQTAEEMIDEAAVAAPANNAAAARVTLSADGRKSAALDESFMSYSIVRKGADGHLDAQCVTGEKQALLALKGKPVAKGHNHAQ